MTDYSDEWRKREKDYEKGFKAFDNKVVWFIIGGFTAIAVMYTVDVIGWILFH